MIPKDFHNCHGSSSVLPKATTTIGVVSMLSLFFLSSTQYAVMIHAFSPMSPCPGSRTATASLRSKSTSTSTASSTFFFELQARRSSRDILEDDDEDDEEEEDDDDDDDRGGIFARVRRRRGRRGGYYDNDDDRFDQEVDDDLGRAADRLEARGIFDRFFDNDDDDDDDDENGGIFADVLIPNPILDNIDPDGAAERFPELAQDPRFWLDMFLFLAFINFVSFIGPRNPFPDMPAVFATAGLPPPGI